MLEWFLFGLFGTFISHVVVPHVSVSLFLLSCAAYVIPASSPFHFLSQHFFLFEPIGQILLNLQKRTNTKQNSCEEERCRRKREDKTNQKFYPFVNFFIIFFHKFVLLVPFLFMPFKKYITYDFSKQIHLMNKFYNLFMAHITR